MHWVCARMPRQQVVAASCVAMGRAGYLKSACPADRRKLRATTAPPCACTHPCRRLLGALCRPGGLLCGVPGALRVTCFISCVERTAGGWALIFGSAALPPSCRPAAYLCAVADQCLYPCVRLTVATRTMLPCAVQGIINNYNFSRYVRFNAMQVRLGCCRHQLRLPCVAAGPLLGQQ